EKSDADQGFEQIIDFLSGSYIHHACLGDVTRLQALVDKKRIVNTKEVVREILQLNDAEGVICLPNDEIFAGLARMGVRKGFSGVETPLFENMLAVKVVDEKEEVQVPAQDDVVQEHVIKEIATEVVLPTPTSPSPSSPVLDKCSALVLRVEGLKNANAAQQLEILKLKARVKRLERLHKVKSSKLRRLKKVGTSQHVESLGDVENVFNQGRISVDMETDEGIELEFNQEKSAEVEGRQVDTQAEIYNIDLDHSSKVVTAAATQPGESLKEAVRRETMEEIRVKVGEVVCHSSQQWPAGPSSMPCQLMVGFL
nr:NUDIX hydrolase 19, chloroplastic [Tanacetum cinerariifolium]